VKHKCATCVLALKIELSIEKQRVGIFFNKTIFLNKQNDTV